MPTHYKGTVRETRALDAFIKINRATESLNARLTQALARDGLTPGQLAVLEALFHLGPMCQKDLGRKLLRSNPNMTTVLDNLERQTLVRRTRDARDRRLVEVSLTRQGRQLISRVFPLHARRVAMLMAALADEEQDALGRLGKKLGLAAAAAR